MNNGVEMRHIQVNKITSQSYSFEFLTVPSISVTLFMTMACENAMAICLREILYI
jgi:hypothetical protein